MRCETCGAEFKPRHPRRRFCGSKCRAAAWKQARAKAQAEREGRVRLLLVEAIRVLDGQKEPDAENSARHVAPG